MRRRSYILASTTVFGGLLAGCLSGPAGSSQATEPTNGQCQFASESDLVSLLPPASDGRTRTVDDQPSEIALDEYQATAAVSADYRDPDDEVLDDLSVRVIRFRQDADGTAVLRGILNDIEFDSGRVGVGLVADRVGVIGIAPRREGARRLLTSSSAISQQCLATHEVLPSTTTTPADTAP